LALKARGQLVALDIVAIHAAIREVLDGVFAGTRDIAPGTYQVGSPDAKASHAMSLTAPTYEIEIPSVERHGAAPMSTGAAHSIETINLDITFTYALPAVVDVSERYATQAAMMQNANLAIQALTHQGNLTTTDGGTATGIVSGMLFGPGGMGYASVDHDRDWAALVGKTTIHASAVVIVTQATS
jgi:hypothetical protein